MATQVSEQKAGGVQPSQEELAAFGASVLRLVRAGGLTIPARTDARDAMASLDAAVRDLGKGINIRIVNPPGSRT